MTEADRCGFTVVDRDGIEQPCDRPASGWRWYQDVEHEDTLDVACLTHENEGGRRLHEAEARLAAVEKLCSDPAYVFDVGVACIRVSDILAALGAAVTPTPQDERDAGTYNESMSPCYMSNGQCVTQEHYVHIPVTSTPEAATETAVLFVDGERRIVDTYPKVDKLQAGAPYRVAAAPSGLQRATEQDRLRATLTGHYLVHIICDHERKLDCPVCSCSAVDLGWHESVGGAVEAWADHVTAVAVGGSDTPADQPEKDVQQ